FQQVLQWGEQMTQTLLGPECPAEPEKFQQPVPQDTGARWGSWWEQLSQTSGVYTTATKERFPFACWTKLRVAAGDTSGSPIHPTWLGRLFGATCPPARGFPTDSDTSAAKSRSVRPSSWLPPSVNVLTLVLKGGPTEKAWPQEQQEKKASDSPQLHRAVRALCDHTGAGDDHLSFRRGDVLQLLATVDEDWIRCCHGNNTGLVPVGYTSLIL
uniref:SH3 domain-containing protein n=1 Tax=Chelonoidis abingdonii TaxID=106734 RepID=A0A8C0IYN8_CHEAB